MRVEMRMDVLTCAVPVPVHIRPRCFRSCWMQKRASFEFGLAYMTFVSLFKGGYRAASFPSIYTNYALSVLRAEGEGRKSICAPDALRGSLGSHVVSSPTCPSMRHARGGIVWTSALCSPSHVCASACTGSHPITTSKASVSAFRYSIPTIVRIRRIAVAPIRDH
jgi:hypothetical protein